MIGGVATNQHGFQCTIEDISKTLNNNHIAAIKTEYCNTICNFVI